MNNPLTILGAGMIAGNLLIDMYQKTVSIPSVVIVMVALFFILAGQLGLFNKKIT
ncbi:MAG TPA: hypothetical protein VJB70_04150 [Candidatus Paceibacterota bacterium]